MGMSLDVRKPTIQANHLRTAKDPVEPKDTVFSAVPAGADEHQPFYDVSRISQLYTQHKGN